MELYRIIDADAHMSEPFEMWAQRIEPKFRDRAPHLVRDYDGKKGSFFLFEDFVSRFSPDREGASQDMKRPGRLAVRIRDAEAALASRLSRCGGICISGERREISDGRNTRRQSGADYGSRLGHWAGDCQNFCA
jgi:hypothetical protein